jgi:hypothetical protein
MNNETETVTGEGNAPRVAWDEPEDCISPRGWCQIDGLSETFDGHKPCGFYLVYNAVRGYRPIEVFAKRYVFTDRNGLLSTEHEACKVFKARKSNLRERIACAKRWIEQIQKA